MNTKTRIDALSFLRSRKRILLFAALMLVGLNDSPCSVVCHLSVGSVGTAIAASEDPVRAQYCNPAVVDYIVRDENGTVLSETQLKSVAEQLPKVIGDAHVYADQVSFSDDAKTFYWQESIDWQKGNKVPSLEFANSETCTMHLTETMLTYHNKKMRLIFNLSIGRDQPDRRPVIDSLSFQEGTFVLDLSGWSGSTHQMVPAERWKRVGTKSEALPKVENLEHT
jgi:hypothetical protein